MMMKKVTVMAIGLTMMATLVACSNAVPSQQKNAEKIVVQKTAVNVSDESMGSWKNNKESLKLDDNGEAKAAFEKATEGLDGYEYEVIAYIGSQVVQGTNYTYLCKGIPVVPDAEAEYLILNVYEDLEGSAEITGKNQLLEVNDENADGGWSYNQGDTELDKNEDVKLAFDKVLEGLDGCNYEPIAYLGSQVTAGNNYAVFCSVTPIVPDAQKSFCIVYISEDLEGNAEMTDVKEINIVTESENSEESSEEQIPSPFTEVSTLSEASTITGFGLTVPEAMADYPDMIIQVMNQEMIEVICVNKENETDVGLDEGYRIRKAEGTDDISGDYNEYVDTYT